MSEEPSHKSGTSVSRVNGDGIDAIRLTKIIASLGQIPEREQEQDELIECFVQNGADIIRVNLSHVTPEQLPNVLEAIQRIRSKTAHAVGILVDTNGPDIRTAIEEPITVPANGEVIFTPYPDKFTDSDLPIIGVDYQNFTHLAPQSRNNSIYYDSGTIRFEIIAVENGGVRARMLSDEEQTIKQRKHVNVPGAQIEDLPLLTPNDAASIEIAAKNDVDYIAVSFVETAAHVEQAKELARRFEREDMNIIAKIESKAGLDNIEEIAEAADAVMIARGDLSVDVGKEYLYQAQERIVEVCKKANTPVIMATEVLSSMESEKQNIPLKAESTALSDVVIRNQVDAVMLSGETAAATNIKKIREVLHTMLRAIVAAEQSAKPWYPDPETGDRRMVNYIGIVRTAFEEGYRAIMTRKGGSAELIARMHTRRAILKLVNDKSRLGDQTLRRGVHPIFVEDLGTVEEPNWEAGIQAAVAAGLLDSEDTVLSVEATAMSLDTDILPVRDHVAS